MSPSVEASQHPTEHVKIPTQKPSQLMSSMTPSLVPLPNTLESQVAFTYMMEFYETQDKEEVLNGENTEILDAVETGIVHILTTSSRSGSITMQSSGGASQNHHLLQHLLRHQHHSEQQHDNTIMLTRFCEFVRHIVIQNYECPEENKSNNSGSVSLTSSKMTTFSSRARSNSNGSSKCILISSEVNVHYQEGKYTEREVETYVYLPIKISMMDGTFQNQIGHNDTVKGVMYIADGIVTIPEEITPSLSPSSSTTPGNNNAKTIFDTGLISVASVGWTIAAILTTFLLLTWIRRLRWEKKRRDMIGDCVVAMSTSSLEENDRVEYLEYDQIALNMEGSSNSLV